jgi:hypothetical protein
MNEHVNEMMIYSFVPSFLLVSSRIKIVLLEGC